MGQWLPAGRPAGSPPTVRDTIRRFVDAVEGCDSASPQVMKTAPPSKPTPSVLYACFPPRLCQHCPERSRHRRLSVMLMLVCMLRMLMMLVVRLPLRG